MKCNNCEAELEEGVTVCPDCGAEIETSDTQVQTEEEKAPETVLTEESVDVCCDDVQPETASEDVPEETAEQAAPPKQKSKIWQLILAISASLVLLAALAIVLLYAFGVDLRPRPNDVAKKDSYCVEDDKAVKAADKVVATVNGRELTNAALQIYYKMQVVDFINSNGTYLSYMNFDYSKPLSEQMSYYDETLTWEQYFINVAIETWLNYQCIYQLSVENGFVPSEELRTSLEDLPATIEKMATEEGFESADAFIKDRFGVTCKFEDYLDYCRYLYVSSEFINIAPTQEEIENFYTENESFFIEKDIDKSSGPMVNVRHILLQPEGGTQDEETEKTVYTDEAWADCLKAAEDLLAKWKAGDATEESFAALANEHSADGGSNTTGGLYTGITRDSSFVENFLKWSVDESRKIGDTGIVQTEFGYHIMYFAYTQPKWLYYANTYFLSDRTDGLLTTAKEQWPIETTYKNIVLPELVIE